MLKDLGFVTFGIGLRGVHGAWESVKKFDSVDLRIPREVETLANRKVRRNPRPLGRGQGARMQIMQSTLEVGESPPFKAGFFNWPAEGPHFSRRLTFIALFVMN